MQFSIIDDDGFLRYAGLDEIRQALAITQPDVLLYDDFAALSIEDGQAPTTGARYADSFVGWGVRRLKNPPNLDQGIKRFVPGQTHVITAGGLSLRALPSDQSETGYIAGMISTERSLTFGPGHRIEIDMAIPSIGPGHHLSVWLMPVEGGGFPEYDILEMIGSNRHAPNGPINAVFMNAKTKDIGNWKQHNVDDGFLAESHVYGFTWTDDALAWDIDGERVHRAGNLYDKEMYLMVTWEVGASSNGDFPGPINESTPWPAGGCLALASGREGLGVPVLDKSAAMNCLQQVNPLIEAGMASCVRPM